MTRLLLLCLAAPLIAACSTTSPPTMGPPEGLPGRSVTEFARVHGLTSRHLPRERSLVLEGGSNRVLLFPGTTVAVVNGKRVDGLGRIHFVRGDVRLLDADWVRLEKSLAAGRPRAARPKIVETAPVSPVVAGPGKQGEKGWRVPGNRRWAWLVIHHSATDSGNAEIFHEYHQRENGWEGLAYHFVIGNGTGSVDGEIEVGYRWAEQKTGAHAGRAPNGSNQLNEEGIGICLVGNFVSRGPSAAQRESLRRLLVWLKEQYGIPDDHVLLHRDIKDTDCPGASFPAHEFLSPRRSVPSAFTMGG